MRAELDRVRRCRALGPGSSGSGRSARGSPRSQEKRDDDKPIRFLAERRAQRAETLEVLADDLPVLYPLFPKARHDAEPSRLAKGLAAMNLDAGQMKGGDESAFDRPCGSRSLVSPRSSGPESARHGAPMSEFCSGSDP